MLHLLPSFESIWAFLLLLFGFGFVIFVHELGHFAVAKWVGIKVTQFAIGFGPSLLSWRQGMGLHSASTETEFDKRIEKYLLEHQKEYEEQDQRTEPAQRPSIDARKEAARIALGLGETEYRLNYLPLGGYVKMLGQEDLNPDASVNDPRSFSAKPAWARGAVICAGVIMNLIFGILFFIIAFMMGVKSAPAIVGDTMPGSPAAETFAKGHDGDAAYKGLRPGDKIMLVDSEAATDFAKVQVAAALAAPGTKVELVVERKNLDNSIQQLTYSIMPHAGEGDSKLLMLGIEPPVSLELISSKEGTLPETLKAAGVEPSMQVISVNGKPVERYDLFLDYIKQGHGNPVPVVFKNMTSGKEATLTVRSSPGLDMTKDGTPHLLGLVPATKIMNVLDGFPAQAAGFQAGDLITQLNEISWPTRNEIRSAVVESKGEGISITVMRKGQSGMDIVDMPTLHLRGKLGIEMDAEPAVISRTLAGSPFESLALPPGSRILTLNDEAVQTFGDIQRILGEIVDKNPGQPTTVKVGYELYIKGLPTNTAPITLNEATVKEIAALPWMPPAMILGAPFKMVLVPVNARTPLAAAGLGIEKTKQFIIQTYLTLARLFQGTVQVQELRGPVGIVHVGTRVTAQGGIPYLLFFLGLISVNLVVINFLPIPITDGGLLLFLIIEKIKGSPVSVRVQTAAFFVGLALIGSVFLITLYHDALRLLVGG